MDGKMTCILVFCSLMLSCKTQSSINTNPKTTGEVVIDSSEKYPQETLYAENFLMLKDSMVRLSTAIIDEMNKADEQALSRFFEKNYRTESLFNGLIEMQEMVLEEMVDVNLKEKTKDKFTEIIPGTNLKGWISKMFTNKSRTELKTELMRIEKNLSDIQNLVLTDLENRTKED